ncbi:Na+/proline symporter [Bernardetia litoralis DSM 6794]|uniref:Na+/proline symporter n=1 Tax=Bernardetia litoralis (strain ATCC 23117 / DSM 6794 / NBRC 15988 / NCIMB 1366 / Fx l1 / Sio-4) TaxID=880071 RepID=I4AHA7_BERLS|nr:sodium:solute symporter family protein [Bernardetia litoralis]AFM03342.1 Na+/proline symporter [Bernardetia litoralis DSM 6794]
MILELADWLIIVSFLLLTLGIGIYYTKKASGSTEDFFLGGRNLPWWVAGTSMVATTFAADTPLLVTELVVKNGISGNWIWWNGLIGGMLTTFLFAKLWRKAKVITDLEFIELRYSGKVAEFLRGFRAVYLGLFFNAVIIAWVNFALAALLHVFFDIPEEQTIFYVAAAMVIVVIYSSLSGLLGVAITDVVQFVLAMTGCIVLTYLVLDSPKIGGVAGLVEKLPANTLNFFPQIGGSTGAGLMQNGVQMLTISLATFFAYVGIQWWASWYPGAEPGGGGYVVQRMMSAKDEEHAFKATLFFQLAHYGLRPWVWILVALSAIILYPNPAEGKEGLGYVMAMKEFLPAGWRGLLLVAFFAAYMSTISTQLNWGASYLINDLYQRFYKPKASSKELVTVSRIATLVIMLVGLFASTQVTSLKDAFEFLIEAGAGLGAVLILRWYWWRINVFSELAATIAPIIGVLLNRTILHLESPYSLFFILGFTTISWVLITFLTQPTDKKTLQKFYKRVKPQGSWKPIRISLNLPKPKNQLPYMIAAWFVGIALGYSFLFGIGYIIFSKWTSFGVAFMVFLGSILAINWLVKKIAEK